MAADTCPSAEVLDQSIRRDLRLWEALRRLLRRVPISQAWRGCVGLGLLLDDASAGAATRDLLLFPDAAVRWLAVLDLPARALAGVPREAHWAGVFRTRVRYGMPALSGPPEATFDLRAAPGGRAGRRRCGPPGAPDPESQPRLFRAFNAISWAMTASALTCRAAWRCRRRRLLEAAGGDAIGILSAGPGRSHDAAAEPPRVPVAYLGFRGADRDRVFGWSTRPAAGGPPHYPLGLLRRLCDDLGQGMPVKAPCSGTFVGAFASAFHGLPALDLVFEGRGGRRVVRATRHARVRVLPTLGVREGDDVALDGSESLPKDWRQMPLRRRWEHAAASACARRQLDAWVRLWFERQLVEARAGLVHAPADLAAVAARDHAVPGELLWDVAPALDCYDEAAEAFVLPPALRRAWDEFAGALPGEVAFDLTPTDPRFGRVRRARGPGASRPVGPPGSFQLGRLGSASSPWPAGTCRPT